MKKYVMANWKNSKNVAESIEMLRSFVNGEYDLKPFLEKVEIVFAPALLAIPIMGQICADNGFGLSAQDLSEAESYGRVNSAQLTEFCQYTVIGHSAAKKAHGDTDDLINLKAREAVAHGLHPVICIGENERQRLLNLTGPVLEVQLKEACFELQHCDGLIVLYEPVWAMGTGLSLEPNKIGALAGDIHALVLKAFGEAQAQNIRFIYAGSVNADNAAEIAKQRFVDGVAVGNASLDKESFFKIVKAVYDSCS